MNKRPAFEKMGIAIQGEAGSCISSLDTEEVRKCFQDTGFVLFTGFNVDTDSFEKFSNRFSDDYMDHRGGGSLREVINKDGDRTILSVAYNYKKDDDKFTEEQETFPLALHSDRSYTNSRPPVMWFYCAVPPRAEGQTIVCDGCELYDQLQPATRELFDNQQIKYIRHYADGEWQLWAQTDKPDSVQEYCDANGLQLHWTENNGVKTEYTCPAVIESRWAGGRRSFVNSMLLVLWQEEKMGMKRSLVRMEDGSRIPAEILADVRATSEALTKEISWSPGDITMIDNTRVMHGRRAFKDSHRQIYVRMARSVDW